MASRLVVVSAPGKVILHGEHAVVYGKTALASSVDLRCYVVLRGTDDGMVSLNLPDFEHQVKWNVHTITCGEMEGEDDHLQRLKELSGVVSETPPPHCMATLIFLYLLTHICGDALRGIGGVRASVAATMPAGAGLGSSAAYSVSLAAALLTWVGEISSQQGGRGEGKERKEGGKERGEEGGEEGGKEGGEEGGKRGASKSEADMEGRREEETSSNAGKATKTPEDGGSTPHTATPPYLSHVSLPEAVLHALREAEEDGVLQFVNNGSLPDPVDGSLSGPVDGSLPGPVDRSLPGPVDGSLPGPVDGSLPGPVDGSLPGPADGSVCDSGGDSLMAALSASSFLGWSQEELEKINRWGLEAEKLSHGTPSGIDNAVSTFGGAITFHSHHIEHLPGMSQLRILLVNTKVPRSTKAMVSGVRELKNKYPLIVEPILESVGAITEKAVELLSELSTASSSPSSSSSSFLADLSPEEIRIHEDLRELFQLNQCLLVSLGVSHSSLHQVCEMARGAGMSAKLTGAGGGGCAVVLVPPGFPEAKLAGAKAGFAAAGFDCQETTIGSRGVWLHYHSLTGRELCNKI